MSLPRLKPDPLPAPAPADTRADWLRRRIAMERDGRRFTRTGATTRFTLFQAVDHVETVLRLAGLHRRALANARAVEVAEIELAFPDLPDAFDGYTILHLTDLHVGQIAGLVGRAADRVRGRAVDLAVITGDIQSRGRPAGAIAASALAPLLDAVTARDGILAVLGNHDSHRLVAPLEKRGVRLLLNEHVAIERGGRRLTVTGLDDVNYFYSEAATRALRTRPPAGFAVALVHSPEMADLAAECGYRLYLSGHTHGGQICLPGGRPVFTALDRHHDLARGAWRLDSLTGYTSRGVGAIHRARFNCPPEIALLRLRRA